LLPLGLLLAAGGLAIRAWAAGHIDKNHRLSVAGPYAYVRNPLYLGSFFLALGFALTWNRWFVLLVIAFFVFIYAPTIRQERNTLAGLFPDEYPAYEDNVPLFIPRATPWKPNTEAEAATAGFTLERYLRHAEWKAALGFAAGSAWLVLRLKLGL
jgi:protein-S-isoprenylcysteine O-methyltransferase Ste14